MFESFASAGAKLGLQPAAAGWQPAMVSLPAITTDLIAELNPIIPVVTFSLTSHKNFTANFYSAVKFSLKFCLL